MDINVFSDKIQMYKTQDDDKVVVVKVKGSDIGGQDCVPVESISSGFDWDSGKLFIIPKEPLERVKKHSHLTNFEYEFLVRAIQNGYKYICRHPNGNVIISKSIPLRTARSWQYNKSNTEVTSLLKNDLKKLTWENGGVMGINSLLDVH